MRFPHLIRLALMIKPLLEWILTRTVSGLIRLSGRTSRKIWINWNLVESLERQGVPVIYCLWHNNLMFFTYVLRNKRLGAMISRSRDGERIAKVLSGFGFLPVRGSSSSGASAALREYARMIQSGGSVAITPDGPRGPRYVLQPGAVALARITGAPIVPLCFAGSRCWQTKSWDRMRLPKPFSRVAVMAGPPIFVEKHTDGETVRLEVEETLRKLAARAERFVGGTLLESEPLLARSVDEKPNR